MKVLLVGGGGREHAIAQALRRSRHVDTLYCAPGNAGIAEIAECVPIGTMDFDGLIAFSDATQLWGLNESTLRKAIAYGKLINGIDVCKFGKQWVISSDAMKREYGEPKAAV